MRKHGKLLFGAALAAGMLASTPAMAAGPVVSPGYDAAATMKAGVRYRNFGSGGTGFDVQMGTGLGGTDSTKWTQYLGGDTWGSDNDTTNYVTFTYDGAGVIETTFPTTDGAGSSLLSYPIGILAPSNYLKIFIQCTHVSTFVQLKDVKLNGIPLQDMVPPSCGAGTDKFYWNVTGVDLGQPFVLEARIALTGFTNQAGSEWSKVEFSVGDLYVPTLMETKQDVMADLQDILNSATPPPKAVADLIRTGIEHLGHSLRPQYWMPDGNAVTNKDGAKVFNEEKKSVDALRKAPYDLVGFAITTLVAVDRKLASDKIAAANPDHDYYAKAVNELAKGDADRDAGYPVNAINHYKKAWEHARKAGG